MLELTSKDGEALPFSLDILRRSTVNPQCLATGVQTDPERMVFECRQETQCSHPFQKHIYKAMLHL